MKRYGKILLIVFFNVAVFAGLLAGIEFGFRLISHEGPTTDAVQWQTFLPYMMFANPHNPTNGFQWTDAFHNRTINAKIINNQLGFVMNEELDFAIKRP